MSTLYFGDCLDVIREHMPDESVDLIYLDPPFNSKRIYNASMGGAQWIAFKDTWQWYEAVDDFHELAGDVSMAPTMEGLRMILGEGSSLAYLSYMANRLRECRRVLKPTGSIYLHCDPTMSHYLKVLLDSIFTGGGGGGLQKRDSMALSSGHEGIPKVRQKTRHYPGLRKNTQDGTQPRFKARCECQSIQQGR